MSQLGLAAAASKVLQLLPNRQRSSAGTTFTSGSSRPSNRRKSRTRSLRDGGDGVSDAKKHNQSVRQGTVRFFFLDSSSNFASI